MMKKLSISQIRRPSVDNKAPRQQTVISIPIEDDDSVLNTVDKKSKKPVSGGTANLLSVIYTLCLTLLGILFTISDALRQEWLKTHANGVFLVYIYTTSTIYLIFLQVYIIPKSRAKHLMAEQKRKENIMTSLQTYQPEVGIRNEDNMLRHRPSSISLEHFTFANLAGPSYSMPDLLGNDITDVGTSSPSVIPTSPLPDDVLSDEKSAVEKAWISVHELQEMFGNEGSSFYLRLGTLLFGLGNMIYIGLELDYYLFSLVPEECDNSIYGWTFVLRMIFVIVQTFFLLKNAQAHVTVLTGLAKLGFMHLIATNFCVWFRTLVNEILIHSNHETKGNETSPVWAASSDIQGYASDDCGEYHELINNATPYLFPFILEYSLTATGIFAVMYLEVGLIEPSEFLKALKHLIKRQQKNDVKKLKAKPRLDFKEKPCSEPHPDEISSGPMHSHHSTFGTGNMSLEKSHRGMFVGFLLMAGVLVAMMMFFRSNNNDETETSGFIYIITELVAASTMLLATVVGIAKMNTLPFRFKPLSVDDFILLISMGGAFFLHMSELLLSVGVLTSDHDYQEDHTNYILAVCSSLVASTQTIFQTLLIISGLRRYTDAKKKPNTFPGRECVTFLIVTNVTVWILRSVLLRQLNHDIAEEYYGELAWIFIVNITLPLLLFFHFHSSVCFAEIWSSAYKPVSLEFQSFECSISNDPDDEEEGPSSPPWKNHSDTMGTINEGNEPQSSCL